MRKIMREYQYKRDRNQDLLDLRTKEIYEKYPDIKCISDEIQKIGLKMTRSIIFPVPENKLQEMEMTQKKLINRKIELFREHKIPEDYLEMKYDCPICKDTGFLDNGDRCNCLKQRMLEDTYSMSNLKNILEEDNFNTFDIDLFSDIPVPERELSPRENMKMILQDMYCYASGFGRNSPFSSSTAEIKDNLIFIGEPGLGKTFMCSCIAKEVLNKGFTVIYQTSFNLMEVIEKYKFKTDSFSSIDEENYNNLFSCDLLIIDDLGTEMPNSFTNSELFNIINSRLNSKKKIIISTNLNLTQINEIYTERILSRILGNFTIYEFYGKDLRF